MPGEHPADYDLSVSARALSSLVERNRTLTKMASVCAALGKCPSWLCLIFKLFNKLISPLSQLSTIIPRAQLQGTFKGLYLETEQDLNDLRTAVKSSEDEALLQVI